MSPMEAFKRSIMVFYWISMSLSFLSTASHKSSLSTNTIKRKSLTMRSSSFRNPPLYMFEWHGQHEFNYCFWHQITLLSQWFYLCVLRMFFFVCYLLRLTGFMIVNRDLKKSRLSLYLFKFMPTKNNTLCKNITTIEYSMSPNLI